MVIDEYADTGFPAAVSLNGSTHVVMLTLSRWIVSEPTRAAKTYL